MAQYTVYITRKIWEDLRRHLEQVGNVIAWDEDRVVPRAELLTRIHEADALLCTDDDRVDRAVLDAAPHLKVISTMSAGVEHIDVATAVARGIIVCYTPGATDEAIADMTMALLLACARNIVDADAFVKQHAWTTLTADQFIGADVQGSTLAIIGLGQVGLQVAHRGQGFGMRVLYYDPRRNIDAEERLGVQYGSLDDILREADFVTLHVPLTAVTAGLITEERLRLMKPTAYLINSAHAEVVNHDALVRALREGWIAGAGLDVFAQEPIGWDDPLLGLPNLILSPHIGAHTYESRETMMRMATQQIIDVLEGRKPLHSVHFPDKAA
ncbi:MAG TPA: D-glycerate dehydrogenase [Armatimonadota bacterium]